MPEIDKGNIGEEFVNQLAYKSYLKYWCYPGPQDEYGDRKEIVDLMILFRQTCILISVKNYAFKGKYDRYFRNTLAKATDQLYGAERKLFKSDRAIHFKHPDRETEMFTPSAFTTIHRIIVNLGEEVQYYPFNTSTKGAEFVHVFDKAAFEKIIGEMDTLPDLDDYLSKRKNLFSTKNAYVLPGEEMAFDQDTAQQFLNRDPQSNPMEIPELVFSGSEADLLASFLRNDRQFPKQMNMEGFNGAFIQLDGEWDEFINLKKVQYKKDQDTISYFIDQFVLNEVLSVESTETRDLAVEMLSLNRFQRRIIAKSFFEFAQANCNKGCNFIARRYALFANTAYLFMVVHPETASEFVEGLCDLAIAAHLIYDKYRPEKIVLIGTRGFMQGFFYAFLPEVKKYPTEYEAQVWEDCRKLGWFTDVKAFEKKSTEYPNP